MDKRKKSAKGGAKHAKRPKSDVNYDQYAYLKEVQDPRPLLYTTIPPQLKEKKQGQLTEEQLDSFFRKGYVLVKDYFDTTLLDKAREAINDLVEGLANTLYNAGKIKNKYEDKSFFNRLAYIEKEYKGAAVVLHRLGILPQAFRDIWSNERILNAVEQIIGPNIAGHPVWNLRTKTPKNEQVTVPWHQDNAYLEPCSLNVLQPTAWIPLIDATKENGCMVLASGGHKKGITATHTCCAGGTWYVDLSEEEMKKTLGIDMEENLEIVEVPYGGVLFLNNAVPHKSLENHSDKVRWSLDLRWQRPDHSNGFYGIGESVLMRTKKDPNYEIDWTPMEKPIKLSEWAAGIKDPNENIVSTVISGPWMHRWELNHHNKHTEALTTASTNYHFIEKA